ncbi:hypothetical protein GYMLUDRAFT_396991 [Collybiopsis luxurians FD-317 M1]|uniref:Methyltransferase domain-containing protein n=1 Tax=Collybiopsis luxurians FD-317 M1 TaxID=944289 RepID=A0A0D0AM04_9AGAR|nr:hypothetical protein GYMLUDRAFT_396991 [Collybiopsis luxurians FD-317 M1]
MHQAEIGPSYMFSGNKLGEEWHRLTAQNEGFKNYLNGKLTLAPLENPRSIIDMGAGTGAWAADAATIYPEAEVLAVDMSPFPDRNFPSNLKYQQFNLLDEFPWRNESFDVIHMRFLMYHIPYGAKFIARVVQLLKPGGFLIIEDSCLLRYPDGIGPAQQKQNEISIAFLHSRGLDPYIGSHLEEFMQATGAFEVISARMEPLCLNPLPTGKFTPSSFRCHL